jgi:hypothetical protein
LKTLTAVLFFGTFIFFNSITAQSLRSIGIKAGTVAANQVWNYSNPELSGINIGDQTRWGSDFGVFAEWLNIPWISIITEVHYIQKGFTDKIQITTEDLPDGTGEYLVFSPHVDYTSIPILIKIRKELLGISIYVIAEPTYDILVAQENSWYGLVLDKFSKTELCATFGFGVALPLVFDTKVGTEVRYIPSLQNSYSTEYLTVRNRCLEFLFIVSF